MYKIRISFMHGKFANNSEGGSFMQISDAFQIFDSIPGSMRYLRTFQYELLAKLEQLGIPILFYTLSMANLRWAVNIATIAAKKFRDVTILHKLEEVGMNLNNFMSDMTEVLNTDDCATYCDEDELQEIPENFMFYNAYLNLFTEKSYVVHHNSLRCSYHNVCVDCSLHENCHRMSLTSFLDNLPPPYTRAKLHAESVLDEVRINNFRLKAFRKHILTSKDLPFKIHTYTDRVEFQARGYPHVHGLGWGDLTKIDENFPGFKSAMMKALAGVDFSVSDKLILIKFADASILCSSDLSDIMAFNIEHEQAQIIRERVNLYNVHKHSKSCKKFQNKCRFFFPRFPSDVTLITQTMSKELSQQKHLIAFIKSLLNLIKKELNKICLETTHLQSIHDILAFVIPSIELDEDSGVINLELNSKQKFKLPAEVIKMILPFLNFNLYEFSTNFTSEMLRSTVYHFCLLFRKKGKRVLHKRPLADIWLNNYQPFFSLSWDANHDVQICFDIYSVIGYISNYVSKPETIASKALIEYYDQIKDKELTTVQKNVQACSTISFFKNFI